MFWVCTNKTGTFARIPTACCNILHKTRINVHCCITVQRMFQKHSYQILLLYCMCVHCSICHAQSCNTVEVNMVKAALTMRHTNIKDTASGTHTPLPLQTHSHTLIQLKAYAKEQGPPNSSTNLELKGYVSDYEMIIVTRQTNGPGLSIDMVLTITNILLHCSIFFTSLSTSYYFYKAVYRNGKKNPIYGAYWASVLFSIQIFFVTVTYYEKDAIMDRVLIIFLVLEFITCMVMAFTFIFNKEVFPIPILPVSCLRIWKCKFKKTYFLCAVALQTVAMWFTVAFLHAFVYNLTNRFKVFLTNPLETFIEFVLYLSLAICFFVVLNLPFYIKVPQCCNIKFLGPKTQGKQTPGTQTQGTRTPGTQISLTPRASPKTWRTRLTQTLVSLKERKSQIFKAFVAIVNILNIFVLIALTIIMGASTRSVALILSQSQDSDARLLIAVLPTVGVTAVVTLFPVYWHHIEAFVRELITQNGTNNDRSTENTQPAIGPVSHSPNLTETRA